MLIVKKRKIKLSRKKADWVKGRTTTLRSTPVKPNQASVDRLSNDYLKQIDKMSRDLNREIKKLFNSGTAKAATDHAMDASISSQFRILINALSSKWTKHFNKYGKSFADRMTKEMDKQAVKGVKQATKDLSGGMSIKPTMSQRTKDALNVAIESSTSYIKSVPTQYIDDVRGAINRSITSQSANFTQLKDAIDSVLTDQYKKTQKQSEKRCA